MLERHNFLKISALCSPFNADFDGDAMAVLNCGNLGYMKLRDNLINYWKGYKSLSVSLEQN